MEAFQQLKRSAWLQGLCERVGETFHGNRGVWICGQMRARDGDGDIVPAGP